MSDTWIINTSSLKNNSKTNHQRQLISVIIPTCNRNELLGKCLNALKPGVQTIDSSNYEVIVTDDSKESIAAEFIQKNYAWVKWVKGPGKGPAANRNNGAKNAKGDWLVFIDDDCLPAEDLLNEYANAIKLNEGTEVFEGFIGVDREKRSFIEESPINETGGFLWSCNFMIAKKLFEDLKGFDAGFPYAAMEDVDLRYRINQAQKQIVFLKPAIVIHPWRPNNKTLTVARKRFRSTLYFLKKHPEMNRKINTVYFLRISVNMAKEIAGKSFKYKFKGLGKHLQNLLIHMYFGFALPFYKLN